MQDGEHLRQRRRRGGQQVGVVRERGRRPGVGGLPDDGSVLGQGTGVDTGEGERVENKAAFLWAKFPKFVLGFLLLSLLATGGAFSKAEMASLAALSRWAFLLTFAGVGLSLDLRGLRAQGWRPVLVAVSGMAAIAVLTFLAVLGAERLGLI